MNPALLKWAILATLAIGQTSYILLFYRQGIYADQWDLVPMLEAYLSNGDWLAKVFELHGGHYHASAYLIMLPLAELTNWSLGAETVVIVLLNLLTFYLFYQLLLSPLVKSTKHGSTIIFACFAALFFSIAHGGNALWSWQIAVYLCIFGFAITVFSLASPQLTASRLMLAASGTLISSFSFSCGFAILPAGFVMILMNGETKHKQIYLFAWICISCFILANFVYHLPASHSAGTNINLLLIPEFLLYYLGTPVAYFSRDLSLIISLIGLIIFAYSVWSIFTQTSKKNRTLLSICLAMAVFSISCGILIALGRLQFGMDQARSFRYIIFAQFFWFSVLLLIWQHLQLKETNIQSLSKNVKYLLSIFLICILFNAQKIGRSAAQVAQTYDQLFLSLNRPSIDKLQAIADSAAYPDLDTLQQHLSLLKKEKLSVLYNSTEIK